jgi:uncharacterized protein YjiS (DUF1127 family)
MTEHHTYHRETLAGTWRGLSHAIGTAAGRLREQRRRAQARRALMACSDRTLADIGIPRGSIHLAVRGVDLADPVAVREAEPWPRLVASIRRWQHSRRERRRVERELAAYSDRELEEIGVRRGDIPAIARAA